MMQNWAAIEISLDVKGRPPVQLLRCAYRASRSGLIALVMNGVEPGAANRVLDPVVARMPLTIPGVAYLPIGDDERVRDAVLSADAILVATARFRQAVLDLGVDPEVIWPTHTLLTRMGQEALFRSLGQWPVGSQNLRRHEPLHVRPHGRLPEFQRA
ncbi:hypothetical protein [Kaistia terrae]|uniref:Universal stress protein n=1 Tax=Kaistia terrae TaxID=537017 RepID=A0ABW0Q6W5_9HYPH|nr:hypothetical protein [Kaistia terrae]MCX5578648.1 hypothetical protein [Kaistia terrae]